MSTSPLSDPFFCLTDEHQAFRTRMRTFLGRVQHAPRSPDAEDLEVRDVVSFIRFLNEEIGARHTTKEEQALFPVLARHLPPDGGPVAVLREEHIEIRGLFSQLEATGQRLERRPSSVHAVRDLGVQIAEIVQTLELHMEEEEEVLFPLAREVLRPADISEVLNTFLRVDAELGRTAAGEPERPRTSTGAALPPFCAAGRARMDRASR